MPQDLKPNRNVAPQQSFSAPAMALPKGGGAIRGIGEKFATAAATGSAALTVPIATSPGRSGFGPELSLVYDSGAGNGPFGFGWQLSLPSIARKTDRGLPRYGDAEESDVYLLSGAEDLVPVLRADGRRHVDDSLAPGYRVQRYRPRVEGLFARIERWTAQTTGESHWRSISGDNITTVFGRTAASRIADPGDPTRIFKWLICESYDDKGNAIVYTYQAEDAENIDRTQAHERHRVHTANRYVKRILYGNRVSRLIQPDLEAMEWLFEVVFDYDEGHREALPLDPNQPAAEQHRRVVASPAPGQSWSVRPDPFSTYRPGFEVRTSRRCHGVLMFHRFPELGHEPYLVRATTFAYADLDHAQPTTIDRELSHQGSTHIASFLRTVTQSGFVRDATQAAVERGGLSYLTYIEKSLPPIELEYSKARISEDIQGLDADSLEHLPMGLDGVTYRWVDLDGEGLAGILTEQGDSWFYKPNLGEGRFGPLQVVATRPSLASLGSRRQQLLDLAGDGQLDLVAFDSPTPGFYERTLHQDWQTFRAFSCVPNVAWDDPNLRFVDLDGDGHADVLLTEHDAFRWHPSLAEEGFDAARRVPQAPDEERGPRLLFADGTESIYLADMCGDGLTDLVRLRNGEVCYWPNLGYGRFGAKVTMDNAPWFDHAEQFEQRRLRLADIDGSGTNDIIYLGRDGARLYFNESGNRWSAPYHLRQFPTVDDLSTVMTADLLGNGTACLVWSSALPEDTRRPLRYVDLMGGQKPHLLVKIVNNLGAEVCVRYAPSTQFYLEDRRAGKPWITRLPFPVHVVERVETYDRVSHNRFVSRYAYHHGYFDGIEREFRGFGLVEQWDTETFATLTGDVDLPACANIDVASHVPPAYTKTWFHTGVYLGRGHVSHLFDGSPSAYGHGEYYHEPGLTTAQAAQLLLDDTILPAGLTAEEERQACRSLKGSLLRREVYALDDSDRAAHPYTVTEQNLTIRMLQPCGTNRHAVFFTHPREAITYDYERHAAEPRVAHALTLEVDDFGNVLREASVAYGRRQPDPTLASEDQATQAQSLITYAEHRFTNAIDAVHDYRTPLPCETCTYELTGLTLPAGRGRLTPSDMLDASAHAACIPYEQKPAAGLLQKRLIEQRRTLYRRDDLDGALPLGVLQALALPFEHYALAFTPGLLAGVYDGRATAAMLEQEGGYVHSASDANWWAPSGRLFYSPTSADTPAQELAYARQHFFLPRRHRDPFHTDATSTERFVTYDAYDLLMVESRDALGNVVTVATQDDAGHTALRLDYRVLQPAWVTDPNGNRTQVAFDALGLVVGTAVMGKAPPAPTEGDALDDFAADLTEAVMLAHLTDPLADPHALLQRATTRLVYDLFAYERTKHQPNPLPAVVYTLARETHDADLQPGQRTAVQHSFAYTDGFGREIQRKFQAEPGPVPRRDAGGKILIGPDGKPEMTSDRIGPRWLGSGWLVFNNKGKPVRRFEPFFTDTHRFERDVRIGVSPVLCYDPVERLVATLHPDHTWEKIVFEPWRQVTWDVNDTVLAADPRVDPDVGSCFRQLSPADYLPTWHALRTDPAHAPEASQRWPDPHTRKAEKSAAEKASVHANSPTITYVDPLGRHFLTVVHNKFAYSDAPPTAPPQEERYRTRIVYDIEGNQRQVIDAKARVVMSYDYDMLGHRVHQASMEAGERWALRDVGGHPLYTWDSRDHRLHTVYDRLRRPTDTFMREGTGSERLVERTIYGETQSNPEANNRRGQIARRLDQAGVAVNESYDFKGNLRGSRRQLARDYTITLNWSLAVPLEAATYASETHYDALNRPTARTTPDNSVVRLGYNEASLLERLDVNLRGAQQDGQPLWTAFVTDIDYDAKGQRTRIDYAASDGTVTSTSYVYDRDTFRLIHLYTRRGVDPLTRLGQAFTEDCTNPYPPPFTVAAPETPPEGHSCGLQNLRYTYDPVGNISHIRDAAQQTIFFRNRRVEPSADYVYDATYRLIEATGREHLGQAGGLPQSPVAPDAFDSAPTRLEHPGDGQAMGRYLERYVYDAVGNIMTLEHRGSDPTHAGWTLDYTYDESSLIDATQPSNRLSSTTVGSGAAQHYTYDGHGNMTRLPHLPLMQWDYRDQLQVTARQLVDNGGTPETTYYVYDADGQRLRQVTERQTPAGQTPTRLHERIYLNGFEIYREYEADGETVRLQRDTLHVMAGQQRVALVETRTQGSDPAPAQLIRYQLGNHLGSASLELDGAAQLISYEEYYPYGSTSYQAVRSQSETPKRYRYSGRERDEASGLIYYGARYYAPWLARWTAADPLGLEDGIHLYAFVANNPVRWTDANGMQVDEYHDFDGLEVQGSGRTLDLIRTASRARQEALRMGDAELAAEYWREMQDLRRQFMREGDIEYAKFAVGTMTIATAAALTGGAAAFGGAALAGSLGLGTVGTGVLVGGAGGAGGAGGKAVAEWALGRDLTGEELMTEMAIGGAFGGVVGLGGGLYLRSATAPTAQSSPVSRVPEEIVMHRWSTGPKSPSLAPRPPEGPIEAFGLRQSSGAMTSRINLQIINKGPDPRFPGYPDNTGKGLWHAWERHGGVDNPGASQFTISLDKLQSLLNAPGVVQAPTYQLNTGNYIRTVQLRQVIGHTAVNRGGEQTPLLTVITDPHGNLVTAFPGTLSGKALVR